MLDPVLNFAKTQVLGLHTATDTSIPLVAGDGARLPNPATAGAFNLTYWNSTDFPDPADDPNREIVRCTARATDTLTIVRAQEGTTATAKNLAGKTYRMVLAMTRKMVDDIAGRTIQSFSNPARVLNTIYQNGSKWRMAVVSMQIPHQAAHSSSTSRAQIGSVSPPATEVCRAATITTSWTIDASHSAVLTFFIPPNFFYRVITEHTGSGSHFSLSVWTEYE